MRTLAPVVLTVLLGIGWAAVGPGRVIAGSGIEAWLDRPIPSSPAAGTRIGLGFVLWDAGNAGLVRGSFPFVRFTPPTDDVSSPGVTATEDWPGHYVVDVDVPDGGIGELVIGVRGTACDADGCHEADALYPIAGAGPPPDAPLPAIAAARIEPPANRIVAGEAAPFRIRLVPNAGWDPAAFPAPDVLALEASVARGPTLEPATATLTDPVSLRYHASVSFPAAGSYVLRVATVPADGVDGTFPTSLVTVIVEGSPSPAPGAPDAGNSGPLPTIGAILAAGLIVVVIAGGVVGGRRRSHP